MLESPTKILMVCLGNICRSPLAQGILESMTHTKNVQVDSAGTGGWHQGELPDHRSIKVAQLNGIDISTQRARQITLEDFTLFDRIYAMDASNLNNLLKLAPNQDTNSKITQILNPTTVGNWQDVPDPYYGNLSDFEYVFKLLQKACEKIASDL